MEPRMGKVDALPVRVDSVDDNSCVRRVAGSKLWHCAWTTSVPMAIVQVRGYPKELGLRIRRRFYSVALSTAVA